MAQPSGRLLPREEDAVPRGAPALRLPVLYLMGHGFSGSTLLTLLLGCHPELATVGELGVAEQHKLATSSEDYLCSCRRPLRQCPFWQRVAREMARRGLAFDAWDSDLEFRAPGGGLADVLLRALRRGPLLEAARAAGLRLVPSAQRQLALTLDRVATLAEVVTSLAGAGVFVDASKRPERALFMLRSPRLDLRVIHLVRDGRAVVWSSMRNLGWSLEQAAGWWRADNRRCESALRRLPADRRLLVRYEDLCADVAGTLARIHRFARVTPRAEVPPFRDREHHVIGNRMRLDSLGDIRTDESWRQALGEEQQRFLERRIGRANRRYGYGGPIPEAQW